MKIENTPTIESERLRLRRGSEEDLQEFYDVFGDETVNFFLPWFKSETMEDCYQFIKTFFLDYYEQPCAYRYAICLKETDKVIGYIIFSTKEGHDMGYGLAKKYWHQGYVQEATQALLQKIKQAGYPFVTATHDLENTRSGAVLKSCGLHYCYSYVEQWQPKNKAVTFRLYQLNFDETTPTYNKYWEIYQEHFIEVLD